VTYLVVTVCSTARLLLYARGQICVEWFDGEELADILRGVDLGLVLAIAVGVNTRMACELVAAAETLLATRVRAGEWFLARVGAYVARLCGCGDAGECVWGWGWLISVYMEKIFGRPRRTWCSKRLNARPQSG
jgi:hypothetical protein